MLMRERGLLKVSAGSMSIDAQTRATLSPCGACCLVWHLTPCLQDSWYHCLLRCGRLANPCCLLRLHSPAPSGACIASVTDLVRVNHSTTTSPSCMCTPPLSGLPHLRGVLQHRHTGHVRHKSCGEPDTCSPAHCKCARSRSQIRAARPAASARALTVGCPRWRSRGGAWWSPCG